MHADVYVCVKGVREGRTIRREGEREKSVVQKGGEEQGEGRGDREGIAGKGEGERKTGGTVQCNGITPVLLIYKQYVSC